ncbi:MAG: lysylphosphatidylglycerol synthase transmembrane domain-containing protein [Pseudomarimonas sp.]
MKRIANIFGLALGLVLFAYFLSYAAEHLDFGHLANMLGSPDALLGFCSAVVLYCASVPLGAVAWKQLLATQREFWPTPRLILIMGSSQLAKYFPGNIAQHATRFLLCKAAGMGARAYVVSSSQEALILVLTSLVLGSIALHLSDVQQIAGWGSSALAGASVLLAAIGVAGTAAYSRHHRTRQSDERDNWQGSLRRLLDAMATFPRFRTILIIVVVYSASQVLASVGLWIAVTSTGNDAQLGLATITTTFCLSWVIGFVAPGAPAGLGVREAVQLLILGGTNAPPETLLSVVLLARLISTIGDGTTFIVATSWQAATTSGPK